MVRARCFFDFALDSEPLGRVVFELFTDIVPKTVDNFRALATGEKGVSLASNLPLSYKDSIIHRSIPGFMVQGGDFTKKNGSGGESIYGEPFVDENLETPLDSEGLLVMANKGPNTNGSQFFVTIRECNHLNGKHVVFGRVVTGYDIITKISEVPTDAKDRPTIPVVISGCGELVLRKKAALVPEVVDPVSPPRGRPPSSSGSLSTDRSRSRSPSRGKAIRKRSISSSRSPTPKRKSKKHAKRDRKPKRMRRSSDSKGNELVIVGEKPREETEEELDARLEREENDRINEAKRLEALRLKERLLTAKRAAEGSEGVRFKGRGTMKYRDPELKYKR